LAKKQVPIEKWVLVQGTFEESDIPTPFLSKYDTKTLKTAKIDNFGYPPLKRVFFDPKWGLFDPVTMEISTETR